MLAPTRRYATAPGATTSTAHVFLDTLVCNVAPRARLLQMPDPLPMGSHSVRGGFGATAGGGTAVAAAATVCGDGAHRHVAWKRDAGEAALPWGHMQGVGRHSVGPAPGLGLQLLAGWMCEGQLVFCAAFASSSGVGSAGRAPLAGHLQSSGLQDDYIVHILPAPSPPLPLLDCASVHPSAVRIQKLSHDRCFRAPPRRAELQRLAEAALPFIERAASQRAGGAPARARTLAFCGAGATVAYSMIGPGSHHCENVGRPHASNHVFFVADLVKGAYAQKCHGELGPAGQHAGREVHQRSVP